MVTAALCDSLPLPVLLLLLLQTTGCRTSRQRISATK
jgi:hypothetical protein